MSRRCALWWHYSRMPLLAFVPLAVIFATTAADSIIAHALFFNAGRWVGGASWWTRSPAGVPSG